MNDFTKEELERLFHLVNRSERIDPIDKKNYIATYELRLKIQSLIDNYCEHTENYICMECLSATCEKCHKIWELKDDNQ